MAGAAGTPSKSSEYGPLTLALLGNEGKHTEFTESLKDNEEASDATVIPEVRLAVIAAEVDAPSDDR